MKADQIYKIYLILLIMMLGVYAKAQFVTIYTPNNTPVMARNVTEPDLTSKKKDELKKYWMSVYNNSIEFLSEATNKYNCHAYAWHMTEGRSPVWINNPVWINTPEDDKYWNDYSYIEVSDPSRATKVSFGIDDHSAITTTTPDYFISKWGQAPLFRHRKNDCPYSTGDLHYFVSPSLLRPSVVCDQAEYTIKDLDVLPQGFTVQWGTNNSNLTLVYLVKVLVKVYMEKQGTVQI